MTYILNARTPVPAPTPDILTTPCHHLATGDRPVRTETIAAAVAEVERLRAALRQILTEGPPAQYQRIAENALAAPCRPLTATQGTTT